MNTFGWRARPLAALSLERPRRHHERLGASDPIVANNCCPARIDIQLPSYLLRRARAAAAAAAADCMILN